MTYIEWMSEGKRNAENPAPALLEAADDELTQACALDWKSLRGVVPWGDRYDGFAADGRAVTFERNYLWAEAADGDILCEVRVFETERGYEHGARASRLIRRA